MPFYDGNTGTYLAPGGGGGGSSTTATAGGNSTGISKGGAGGTSAVNGSNGILGGGGGGGGTNSKTGGTGGNGFILIYFNPYELYVNGETTLNGALQVNSTITATGTVTGTNITSTSDISIKENIQDLDLSLYNVGDLRPVSYLNTINNRFSVGLIADELQLLYPFLVFGEKEAGDLLSIDYISLIPILIRELKEQKIIIQALKTILERNNIR